MAGARVAHLCVMEKKPPTVRDCVPLRVSNSSIRTEATTEFRDLCVGGDTSRSTLNLLVPRRHRISTPP